MFVESGLLTSDLNRKEDCSEVNLVMRINKCILAATMWQTPLYVVRDLHMHFSRINMSTAMHRPVKLMKHAGVSCPTPTQSASQAVLAICATVLILHQNMSRRILLTGFPAVCNTTYCMHCTACVCKSLHGPHLAGYALALHCLLSTPALLPHEDPFQPGVSGSARQASI